MNLPVCRVVVATGPWRFLSPIEPTLLGDAARFFGTDTADGMWEYVPKSGWSSLPLGELPDVQHAERIRPLDETAQLVVTEIPLRLNDEDAQALRLYVEDRGYRLGVIPRPK